MGIDIVIIGARIADKNLRSQYDLSGYHGKIVDSHVGVCDIDDALGWIEVLVEEQLEGEVQSEAPLIVHVSGEGAEEVAIIVLSDQESYPNIDILAVRIPRKSRCD